MGNRKPTKIITIDRSLSKSAMVDLLLPAVSGWKRGGHVVFPTETVYGLCCDPVNETAIRELYEIKGRDFRNPLTLHLSSAVGAKRYVQGFDREEVQKLISVFWPGPLTLVLPKTVAVSDLLTGGLSTVGLRYPSDLVAQTFIDACGGVVAGTSANLSGNMAITHYEDLEQTLVGKVDYILSADFIGGLESTVLDLSCGAKILRPGLVSSEMIEGVLGYSVEKAYTYSPVADARKYAVSATLKLFDRSDLLDVLKTCSGHSVGVLVLEGELPTLDWDLVKQKYELTDLFYTSVMKQNYASVLYDVIHSFERRGIEIILAPKVEQTGVGAAIMHRLEKSAGLI